MCNNVWGKGGGGEKGGGKGGGKKSEGVADEGADGDKGMEIGNR